LSWRAEPLAGPGPFAESWAAEWARLTAFAYRNLIMARRNVFFVFELTFWPGVAMLSHGLLTRFLHLTPEMTAFILVGTVALSAVQVCQLDVAYAVLFDIWSKSMKHQFLTPVRIHHLALGSWLAFRSEGDQALVMGDLVLTADEVSPVMRKLAGEGIEITALHNHLLRAAPPAFYMHVRGYGDPVKLAAALHDGLLLSKTPLMPATGAAPSPIELDTASIDRTLDAKGKVNGGVYQVSLKRAETVTDAGMAVPEAMGTAVAINFQPTGQGKAAIAGDFVLTANEVNPVLRALRANDIEVTALHNHMLDDVPRMFFMHFWANANLTKLTAGLKAALDQIRLANQ